MYFRVYACQFVCVCVCVRVCMFVRYVKSLKKFLCSAWRHVSLFIVDLLERTGVQIG